MNGAFKGVGGAWLSLGMEKESSPKANLGWKRLTLIDSADLLSICSVTDVDAGTWDAAVIGTPRVPAFFSLPSSRQYGGHHCCIGGSVVHGNNHELRVMNSYLGSVTGLLCDME